MKKRKLAICIHDKEYQNRFLKCWMNHFKDSYEVHIFTNIEDDMRLEEQEYEVLLVDENTVETIEAIKEYTGLIVCLVENENVMQERNPKENMYRLEKYQEVYKIEQWIRDKMQELRLLTVPYGRFSKKQWIGVYSLDCELMQLPFAAMTAMEYGEKTKVLVVNLQAMSGMMLETDDGNGELNGSSMEDLLTAVVTNSYTRARILGGIGHEQNWDYIYPAKNSECLAEASKDTYETMIQILSQELEYTTIILNFGTVFSGIFDLMELCDDFYLLTAKKDSTTWREKAFREEMRMHGKEEFLQKIKRVEIPHVFFANQTWYPLAHQWRWNPIGDNLRKCMWMEKNG